jgi:hypothetical protein
MAVRKTPGRSPAWIPTAKEQQQIVMLREIGIERETIGKILGVSSRTLRRKCKYELEHGAVVATAEVARSLYLQATGRCKDRRVSPTAAAIFWLKTRARWSERIVVGMDPTEWDDATLDKFIETAEASIRRRQGGWTPRVIDNTGTED